MILDIVLILLLDFFTQNPGIPPIEDKQQNYSRRYFAIIKR